MNDTKYLLLYVGVQFKFLQLISDSYSLPPKKETSGNALCFLCLDAFLYGKISKIGANKKIIDREIQISQVKTEVFWGYETNGLYVTHIIKFQESERLEGHGYVKSKIQAPTFSEA